MPQGVTDDTVWEAAPASHTFLTEQNYGNRTHAPVQREVRKLGELSKRAPTYRENSLRLHNRNQHIANHTGIQTT